jgi:hypothetical protein
MIPAGAAAPILAAWTGVVILLAMVHWARRAPGRREPLQEAPVTKHGAAAPPESGLPRCERDRRIAITVMLTAISFAAAMGTGAAVMSSLGPSGLPPLLFPIFALVLGWGIQSVAFLFLGLAGRLRRAEVSLVLAAGLGAWLLAGPAWPAIPEFSQPWSLGAILSAAACLGIVGMAALACFAPPRGFDAMAYHLELPRRYAETGRLTYVPFMAHSPWPQGGHMLFMPGLLFRCFHFPQLTSLVMGVALAGMAFETARVHVGLQGGWLAALLVLGMAELVFQMTEPSVDIALGLFTMAGLSAWATWLDARENSLLILAGVFAGLAVSTKLTGLALVVLLAVGAATAEGSLRPALILAGPALLVSLPWHVRSARLTGNPFFHFATGVFRTRNWPASSESAHRLVAATDGWGPLRGWRTWLGYATRNTVASPAGWGAGIVALVPAIVCLPGDSSLPWLGTVALALVIVTLLLTDQIRLLFGAAAGVGAAAAAAATLAFGALPELWSALLAVALGTLSLAGALRVLHHKLRAINRRRRASYLRRFLPYYDDFLWMNGHLPRDVRILLWSTRGYLLERDYVWLPPWQQGVFDFTRILDAGTFWQEMRSRRITHVYFTEFEIRRPLFGWLHALHEEMVREGMLVEEKVFETSCTLFRVA